MTDDRPTDRPPSRRADTTLRIPLPKSPRFDESLVESEAAAFVTDALTRLAMKLPTHEGVLGFARAFCMAVCELSPGTRVGVRLHDGTRAIDMHAGASDHDLARLDDRDDDEELRPMFSDSQTTLVVPVRTPEVLSLHLAASAPATRRELRTLAERVTPVLVAGVAAEVASQRALDALRAPHESVARVFQAERKIAVAEIASRIVHDLQQPFTAVTNYATHLARVLERAGSDPRDLMRLDALVVSIERARALSSLLLFHAVPMREQPEMLSLGAIVDDAARFSEGDAARAGARIEVVNHRDLPAVLGRQSEITRVLLNVLNNACDAVAKAAPAEGGRVEITVATNEAGGATVSVQDNGGGIGRHALDRIFEPFYSSKTPREGTGLGLAIAREIVEAHGGTVLAKSDFGRGTRFDIVFPPAEQSPFRAGAGSRPRHLDGRTDR